MVNLKVKAETKADRTFDVVNVILVAIITLLLLYPLWFVVMASFSNPREIFKTPLLLVPQGFNLEGYKMIFTNKDIWTGMRNSVIYTVLGTLVNLVMTTLAAYPLSRRELKGKGPLTFFFTFTMFFSGGLIPSYLLNQMLGIVNTVWVMVIPGAISVYNMIIMRTYFVQSIPTELEESAYLDGASDMQLLIKIVLPLSTPIIAVMTMFYGLGRWNSYFDAMIYLSNRSLFPLQLILREILIQNQTLANNSQLLTTNTMDTISQSKEAIKYASIVISTLPILVLYPITAKYFEKGIMLGSVKG
ncbi:carbohydrate ABC transporter permease [Lacticaseibacillus parakribbianus]|uniref:carbohydrate ABC transporter permease n=1 Tax=Lacticaseibacillus parakribbianus TaxID=2970927 RepID=UPI0021CB12DC|nr:carbohydrate ABC transporter permease [Lacticaseibacillus parakribbianus]